MCEDGEVFEVEVPEFYFVASAPFMPKATQ